MTTAANVARYLIHLAGADPEGEPMTAMRLQKLLYYCQGWHLAWFGRPLFVDRIEAWMNGPVVPPVYDFYRDCGRNPLPEPDGADGMSAGEREAVSQVWGHYRRFSTIGLRDMTHEEPPWRDHYHPDERGWCDKQIPEPDLADFFGAVYRRETGDRPGGWGESDPQDAVSLDQLRQELGC